MISKLHLDFVRAHYVQLWSDLNWKLAAPGADAPAVKLKLGCAEKLKPPAAAG